MLQHSTSSTDFDSSASKIIAIVHIEDSEEDFMLLQRLVTKSSLRKKLGITITLHHANTLAKGVSLIKNIFVDLIVVDMQLPDGNGLGIIQKLRAEDIKKPVIVLSTRDDDNFAIETIRNSAQEYIIKNELDEKRFIRAVCHSIERHNVWPIH